MTAWVGVAVGASGVFVAVAGAGFVGEAVGVAVDGCVVAVAVGVAVGVAEGDAVLVAVADAVGSTVFVAVGVAVGVAGSDAVSDAVADAVGVSVGVAVGDAVLVGGAVGVAVGVLVALTLKANGIVAPLVVPFTSLPDVSLKDGAGSLAKVNVTFRVEPSVVIHAGLTVKATVNNAPSLKALIGKV